LAQINLDHGNIKRALRHQERSLFLNPNDDRTVCAMGEILAFAGRAEEAEQWVMKSMRLNPYHPPRYWTHLARAFFHQQRYEEAREALEHVGKSRIDDLAYRVAASAALEDTDAVVLHVTQLLSRSLPASVVKASDKANFCYWFRSYRRPFQSNTRGGCRNSAIRGRRRRSTREGIPARATRKTENPALRRVSRARQRRKSDGQPVRTDLGKLRCNMM
jgi:tetratricopeptide (TPR) repeat protein